MNWFERRFERLRAVNPHVIDGALAVVFGVVGLITMYAQDLYDDRGTMREGLREPTPAAILTVIVICAPIAFRRQWPLAALTVSGLGTLIHLLVGWPEGSLPFATLFLTYNVAVRCPLREAIAGLVIVSTVIVILGVAGSPGLDAVGAFTVIVQFSAVWAIGVAMRSRRLAIEARLREANERAEAEHQMAARALAEERLRIAQELHDVVAHSISVIAVQAGVGAHVLAEHPEQAREALQAISATSRSTLAEMRRLLGVLRDDEGGRSHAPAPCLSDLPRLIDDVRSAGVPATLHVEGNASGINAAVELSAYRVVQEALTNVIKHAGAPTRVDVTVTHRPDALAVEVIDDGRGLAARSVNGSDGSGHGLIGMRERVEVWGGELSVGPAPGGGFRVMAAFPYGDGK